MEIPFPGLPFRAQQGFTRLPRRGRCLYKFKTKPLIFHFSSQAAPNGGKCPKGERGAVSKKVGRMSCISSSEAR